MDASQRANDEARRMRSTKPCGPDTPMLVWTPRDHDPGGRWL